MSNCRQLERSAEARSRHLLASARAPAAPRTQLRTSAGRLLEPSSKGCAGRGVCRKGVCRRGACERHLLASSRTPHAGGVQQGGLHARCVQQTRMCDESNAHLLADARRSHATNMYNVQLASTPHEGGMHVVCNISNVCACNVQYKQLLSMLYVLCVQLISSMRNACAGYVHVMCNKHAKEASNAQIASKLHPGCAFAARQSIPQNSKLNPQNFTKKFRKPRRPCPMT